MNEKIHQGEITSLMNLALKNQNRKDSIIMTIRPFDVDKWVKSLTDEEKETMLMYHVGDDKHGIPLKDFIKNASRFIIPKAY